jgi:hypothetical protein
MRGRLPSGPEYVDQLAGSDQAKERLKTVLETLAGTCRVQEACRRLSISEPRFHQLRQQVLEAGLAELEPRAKGRPAKIVSPAEEELVKLQEQLTAKEVELRAAQVREEIALVLPQVVQEQPSKPRSESANPGDKQSRKVGNLPGEDVAAASVDNIAPEKKTRRRRRQPSQPNPSSRRPPPVTRKPT